MREVQQDQLPGTRNPKAKLDGTKGLPTDRRWWFEQQLNFHILFVDAGGTTGPPARDPEPNQEHHSGNHQVGKQIQHIRVHVNIQYSQSKRDKWDSIHAIVTLSIDFSIENSDSNMCLDLVTNKIHVFAR